jgi:hypothetical protein
LPISLSKFAGLAAALSPQEKSLIERRPTENLEAYDAYLKAHHLIGLTALIALGWRRDLLARAAPANQG